MPPLINRTELEELLQCPVCFEVPSGAILQCVQGHGICQSCCRKLAICPVCRGAFHGTRNFAVEGLIDKMKRINIIPGKLNSRTTSTAPKIIRRAPPNASEGLFPCRIPDCGLSLPACRMLVHIRNCHKEILIESETQDGTAFTRIMDILWVPAMRQVFAMQIADMGLFFLLIDNINGHVRAWLQMVAHQAVAENLLYEINFHSGSSQIKTVFIDKVQSVRIPDGRVFSKKAGPICTVIPRNLNIFNIKNDFAISRMHLAITFGNTFQPTIVPTVGGTVVYRNCQTTRYPVLNRPWRFDLTDPNNMLQGRQTVNNQPRAAVNSAQGNNTMAAHAGHATNNRNAASDTAQANNSVSVIDRLAALTRNEGPNTMEADIAMNANNRRYERLEALGRNGRNRFGGNNTAQAVDTTPAINMQYDRFVESARNAGIYRNAANDTVSERNRNAASNGASENGSNSIVQAIMQFYDATRNATENATANATDNATANDNVTDNVAENVPRRNRRNRNRRR